MKLRKGLASLVLIAGVVGGIAALAYWKFTAIQAAAASGANQPEPSESVAAAAATPREFRRSTTSIGTVLALRSINLRNENAGTVRDVHLAPGKIVDAGTVLIQLDISVEEAELKALQSQAALAQTVFDRTMRLRQTNSSSPDEVDRARAERDVALAQIARVKAVIDRKTIRAPFKSKIGMADIHPGQYLNEGFNLTTLQGVDDAVHVDFAVNQHVAAELHSGDKVEILGPTGAGIPAQVIAVDAKVDPITRNAWVRARVDRAPAALTPGAAVRVRVPVGPPRTVVAVPATAVRKGATGDHVFILGADKDGKTRAHTRKVEAGMLIGDDMLIYSGLKPGEQVAAAGSFKLREGMLVAIIPDAPAGRATAADSKTTAR